jgi:retrograde regulation protein 2
VAINSEEFRAKIKDETGLTVEMLPKEEEGRVGANGVVASFESVRGIVMDLGGGSTQITWIDSVPPSSPEGIAGTRVAEVKMADCGSVSMPYGAAALSRRLNSKTESPGGLRDEIVGKLKAAVQQIQIPKEVYQPDGSLNLYLSGGGFRGWGFVLMSQNPVTPYPIPIINGFKVPTENFRNVSLVTTAVESQDEDIFRVSERRASQVPAVALLVGCLMEVLPQIGCVHFAQGGVREGVLFRDLKPDVQGEHPMAAATQIHARKDSTKLASLLKAALPGPGSLVSNPWVENNLLTALAQGMYIHSPLSKDIQAAAALRSTSTGVLSGILGADHQERALLGVMLCERWGGSGALAPSDANFYDRLVKLLNPPTIESWWAIYLGRIASLLGEAYPAGMVDPATPLSIKTSWGDYEHEKTGRTKQKLSLELSCTKEMASSEAFTKALRDVEKLGKKKNWVLGAGFKIDLVVLNV